MAEDIAKNFNSMHLGTKIEEDDIQTYPYHSSYKPIASLQPLFRYTYTLIYSYYTQ